ncbi:MAG: T9SS type A sorting domain-containing protein, partial [Draconibacterium sp.]|nr:T9SS type A sorting domain-containing protein [Draconibacterium sp.]
EFDCEDIGENVVKLTATDPSGNSSTCEAVVTVFDTIPPSVDSISDVTITLLPGICETLITNYPEIKAVDKCELSFEQVEGLGPDGIFPIGNTLETWEVTDAGGNKKQVSFNVVIMPTNAPPMIDPIPDIEVDEDSPVVNIPLTGITYGSDCNPQSFTVEAKLLENDVSTQMTLNYQEGDGFGSIDLTIAPEMSGVAEIVVKVTDSEGDTITESFMVTVKAVNDPPYVVNPVPDMRINASYMLIIPIQYIPGLIFNDIDDETLELSIMTEDGGGLPSWAMMINDTIICKPLIADTGCVNVIITATDMEGASAKDTFELCVDGYPVNVNDLSAGEFQFKLYPNPTSGIVNIETQTLNVRVVELSVVDITGKTILQRNYSGDDRFILDLSDRESGFYFIRMRTDKREVVKKLIINR